MFFVGDIAGENIGVVDTNDMSIEYWKRSDLLKLNIQILGFDYNTGNVIIQNPCNIMDEATIYANQRKFGYRLYSHCIKNNCDIFTYMRSNYLFGVHDYLYTKNLHFINSIKMFDYSETLGFIILALEVTVINTEKTLMLVKVNSGGYLTVKFLGLSPAEQYYWKFGKEPSGSGKLYNMRIKLESNKCINLQENKLFLKIYYSNINYVLFDVADFSIVYLG